MLQPALVLAALLVGQVEALPPSEELPPPAEEAPAAPGGEELAEPVEEAAPAPEPAPAFETPAAPEAAPLEVVEDLKKPPLGPDLASTTASALIPLVLWTPSLLLCCGSSLLFAAVWPTSLGDPTLSTGGEYRTWGTLCCMACPMGCFGWLLALPTSIVAGLLSSLVGSVVGAAVGIVRGGGLVRVMASAAAGLAAGLVSTLVGLVLVGVVGFSTWALAAFIFSGSANSYSRTPWSTPWWFAMNVLAISTAVVTLGAVGTALALPPAATVGTFALMRKATSGLATTE